MIWILFYCLYQTTIPAFATFMHNSSGCCTPLLFKPVVSLYGRFLGSHVLHRNCLCIEYMDQLIFLLLISVFFFRHFRPLSFTRFRIVVGICCSLSQTIIFWSLLHIDFTAVHKAILFFFFFLESESSEIRFSLLVLQFGVVTAFLKLLFVDFFLILLAIHWFMELLDFRLRWKGIAVLILQQSRGCAPVCWGSGVPQKKLFFSLIHCTSVYFWP